MATCAIAGVIQGPDEAAILSAEVRARLIFPVFSGTSLLVPEEVSTVTNSSGQFTLTLSQSQTYLFTVLYPPNITDSTLRVSYAISVPAAVTASFSNIIISE